MNKPPAAMKPHFQAAFQRGRLAKDRDYEQAIREELEEFGPRFLNMFVRGMEYDNYHKRQRG